MTDLINSILEKMRTNGFGVQYFDKADDAANWLITQIAPGETIGIGGSVTVKELGIGEMLRASGHDVAWHWFESGKATLDRAAKVNVYLTSSNAITRDGALVNIDRTGNRVAAMAYGPDRVYVICGFNKIVDGGISAAIGRIKREACPPNARRLQLSTPCAETGVCNAAVCKNGLCNVTTIMEKACAGHPITVVLINQKLGY